MRDNGNVCGQHVTCTKISTCLITCENIDLPISELNNLYSWLKANKLSLNIANTEFMVISTRQKFLAENCTEINIQLDGHPICRVEHAKSLGSIIDDRFTIRYDNFIYTRYFRQ